MDASADWARAARPGRRIGDAVEYHPTIGSTNDRARAALLESGVEGLAVVADLQEAGRGRRGRAWVSPPGVNLMVSVALRPRLDPLRSGLLGLAAAVAVRDACAVAGAEVGIRWPNDIVAPDGLKVAGLLVETTLEADRLADAVIGAGINVNWRRAEMPGEIAARATSLADLAGEPLDRIALLRALLDALDRELRDLEGGGSPLERFRAASVLDGRGVSIEIGDAALEGTAAGIADDGSLLLDTPAGRIALAVGEVIAVRDLVEETA